MDNMLQPVNWMFHNLKFFENNSYIEDMYRYLINNMI